MSDAQQMEVTSQPWAGPQTHEEAKCFHQGFIAGLTVYARETGHSTLRSANELLRRLMDEQRWKTIETYEKLGPVDDHLPSDCDFCRSIARPRRGHPDEFILDEISTSFYLRFDCTPDDDGNTDAMVLMHQLPEEDHDWIVLLHHSTRGDIRRLLAGLQVKKLT